MRRCLLPLVLVLAGAADLRAASDAFRREYCSLLAGCALAPPPGLCPTDLCGGVAGVTYDSERCAEARDLALRGVASQDPQAFPIYRFLGKRYRVSYVLEGTLAVSAERLAFLLDDLPLAAKLLSRLGENEYTAWYLDDTHRRFRGSKRGTLAGDATCIAGAATEGWLAYFGVGESHVGFWTLSGQSLARVQYAREAAPRRGLKYSLQVLVTPDNAFINRIMTLGLFRSLVRRQIRAVVDDIDAASRRLAETGVSRLAGEWTADEKARLQAFLALPG